MLRTIILLIPLMLPMHPTVQLRTYLPLKADLWSGNDFDHLATIVQEMRPAVLPRFEFILWEIVLYKFNIRTLGMGASYNHRR